MKDGLKEIIGRQIAAVVVASSDKRSPRNQVFLVFSDGSNFEFWGDTFSCCGSVNRTRDIERYIASGGGKITAVYTDPAQERLPKQPMSTGPTPAVYHVPAGHDLENLMTKDLAAWRLAKQAIFRAKFRAERQ